MKYRAESLVYPAWVLIVDSDAMLADAYERIIESAGGRPLSVGKSREAKLVLQNKRIDVVLLDLKLPRMDGMELLQWLHERTDLNPITIVLSNHDKVEDITKALHLGAARYILKAGASPNDLIRVLNKTFEFGSRTKNCFSMQH